MGGATAKVAIRRPWFRRVGSRLLFVSLSSYPGGISSWQQMHTDKTKLKLDREVGGGNLVLNGGAEV